MFAVIVCALKWWSPLGITRPRPPSYMSGHLSRVLEVDKGKKIPSSERKPTEQMQRPFYFDLKEVEGVDNADIQLTLKDRTAWR